MLHAIILAGGAGSRLWPLSRAHYPKQFLQMLGPYTLLQQTILRVANVVPPEKLWIITGSGQEFLVRSQISGLPDVDGDKVRILTEPASKNTAAAIGLAALHVEHADPEAVVAVLPADHWIEQQSAFLTLLQKAACIAQQGFLVTFGVAPSRPESGYGYLCRGEPLVLALPALEARDRVYCVNAFVEKPRRETAERFVASGDYYWNAGIFVWQAATILQEIAAHMPALAQGLAEIGPHLNRDTEKDVTDAVYSTLESTSIDYGVLEKSFHLAMLPADIGWSDLGDWAAIHRLSPHDARGNALNPNVYDLDSENSFVYGRRRTIATIGLKNMVVVDADDILLVCPQERVQEVRAIAHQLEGGAMESAEVFSTVHRPWGEHTVLEKGAGFKVKRLLVLPGAALSLQLHKYRSEHWVVVTGAAQVTNGDQEYELTVGQSTYVPQGTRHRITNPSTQPLEIIEVQTGAYLGEDDIVRFTDLYQRVTPLANLI